MKRGVVRVACVQLRSVPDVNTNVSRVLEGITNGARVHGAAVVAFPENSIFLSVAKSGDMAPVVTLGVKPTEDDSWLKRVCDRAVEEQVAVLLPMLEREGDKVYNTALWIDTQGIIRHRYRKVHLFDYGALAESKTIAGGDSLCSFDTQTNPSFMAALSICFDVRFPHMYQAYAEAGAEVVFVPSAFTLETGKAHWLALLRARAIEGQCYIVAPAQWGTHSETRASHGESCIIDPWGTVVALCSNKEGLISADLDLDYLAGIRERMPINSMRRPFSKNT